MTEELSPREHAFLKLIDMQAKEITQLGMEIDTLRYNKRFTNTKFVKAELASPTYTKGHFAKNTFPGGIPSETPEFTFVKEETKLKRRKK